HANVCLNKSPYESPDLDFDELANSIIEKLRITSDLKYSSCKQIVESIVASLSIKLPHNDLKTLLCSVQKDVLAVENCYDARQITRLLDIVSEWCADHQERNWSLLEDEMQMIEAILELNSYIDKADPRVSLFAITREDFKALNDLVNVFNLEARIKIRVVLLQTIKLCCLLSPKIPRILLTTILPTELVQNVNTALVKDQIDSDIIHLAIDILVFLFCCGECIPFSLYDVFNIELMKNIIELIEKVRPDHQLVSKLSNFLISFNLHQAMSPENIIVDAICRTSCKNFIGRLLYLVNRGIESSASVIYSNDLLVVFNIIQREILNLQPGKTRSLFRDLLRYLVINSDKDFIRDNNIEINELINLPCDSETNG
uniref:SPIN90/Ldb17 leucine-rich domain-containing protein n=1 Tax=Romanomermis culicivorax TaxID=13658 RepID=A0A915KKG9_ROMCU